MEISISAKMGVVQKGLLEGDPALVLWLHGQWQAELLNEFAGENGTSIFRTASGIEIELMDVDSWRGSHEEGKDASDIQYAGSQTGRLSSKDYNEGPNSDSH